MAAARSCPPLEGVPDDRLLRWFGDGPVQAAERRRLGTVGAALRATLAPAGSRPDPVRRWILRLAGSLGRGYRAAISGFAVSTLCDLVLLRGLSALIERLNLGARDHLVLTSAEPHLVAAAVALLALRGQDAVPALHLRLMFDDRYQAGAGAGLVELLKQAASAGVLTRARLYAETEALARVYADATQTVVGVWPYPPPDLPRPDWTERPLVVAFLGEARSEKGLSIFRDLALDAARAPIESLSWVVQLSGDAHEARAARADPALNAALRRLNAEVITATLDDPAYDRILGSAHLVLALHDPEAYRLRGSGVAYEAAATGRLVLARPGVSFADATAEIRDLAAKDASGVLASLRAVAADPLGWGARADKSAREMAETAPAPPRFTGAVKTSEQRRPVLRVRLEAGTTLVVEAGGEVEGAGLELVRGPLSARARARAEATALVLAAGAELDVPEAPAA